VAGKAAPQFMPGGNGFIESLPEKFWRNIMNRKDKLNKLLDELRQKQIYETRNELEDFLQEEDDDYTHQLQQAISEKLDGYPFPYIYFTDFLAEFKRNEPGDSAGYPAFRSRIYGE
jgi:hypothetical protein